MRKSFLFELKTELLLCCLCIILSLTACAESPTLEDVRDCFSHVMKETADNPDQFSLILDEHECMTLLQEVNPALHLSMDECMTHVREDEGTSDNSLYETEEDCVSLLDMSIAGVPVR